LIPRLISRPFVAIASIQSTGFRWEIDLQAHWIRNVALSRKECNRIMSNNTLYLNDALYDYMKKIALREPDLLFELRRETSRDPMHIMQISPEQGRFMAFLTKLINATRAIEIGVYTGYSSLCVAMAMPSEGRMVVCDVNEQWTDIARDYWEKAGVVEKIDLRLGPAVDSLDTLMQENGHQGAYDFAFIDADKENYDAYYERCLNLVRPNGLILIDNAFWQGSVADLKTVDPAASHIRQLNQKIRDDQRVDMSLLPIGDGLMLVRKKRSRQ
jgi:predicted O-methyltransferase YrrM